MEGTKFFKEIARGHIMRVAKAQEAFCRQFLREYKTHRLNVYRVVDDAPSVHVQLVDGEWCFSVSMELRLYKPRGWVCPLPD